jgi:hypothetical protein
LLSFGAGESIVSDVVLVVPPRFDLEALHIFGDDERATKRQIDDAMILAAGMTLSRQAMTSREGVRYLHFLHLVDDGEAQALAMAEQRALPLLTDDIAGTMVAQRIGVEVVSTLDLLHAWSATCDAARVRAACRSLRARGRYAPPKGHRFGAWYAEQLGAPASDPMSRG